MNIDQNEPPDHHLYQWMTFFSDTFEFYFAAVRFYESRLQEDLLVVKNDQYLEAILSESVLESFPIAKELKNAIRIREWIAEEISKAGKDAIDYEVNITHGVVRFIKSAALLYLEQLQRSRNSIAARSGASRVLLAAVDQQISKLDEKLNLGVFKAATPYPLVLNQLPGIIQHDPELSQPLNAAVIGARPRTEVIGTIEIQDEELRKRCLDIFDKFREDGANERLDTVVNEATRILEHRLRALSTALAECTGVDLAKHCFGGEPPRLTVSEIKAEQDAAHLLFRGVFGFIRNSVHHRLVGTLQPVRVIQIVGMVDYLISVAEGARRSL